MGNVTRTLNWKPAVSGCSADHEFLAFATDNAEQWFQGDVTTCPWFVSTAMFPGADGSRFHTARAFCVPDFWPSMAKGHWLQSWKPFWSHGPLAPTVAVGYVSSTKAQQFLEDTRTSLFLSEPVSQPASWLLALQQKGRTNKEMGVSEGLSIRVSLVTNTWEKKAGKLLTFPVTTEEGSWGLSPPEVTTQQWDTCTPALFCGLHLLSPQLVEGVCEGMQLWVSCEVNGSCVVTDPHEGWMEAAVRVARQPAGLV